MPSRKWLSCWPPFPISSDYSLLNTDCCDPEDEDGNDVELIDSLKHPDRVYQVYLGTTTLRLDDVPVVAMMQVPFSELTHLGLTRHVEVL